MTITPSTLLGQVNQGNLECEHGIGAGDSGGRELGGDIDPDIGAEGERIDLLQAEDTAAC